MKSILETVERCREFLYLTQVQVQQIPYRFYREIDAKSRGIYILEDEVQQPIYVGKGWIRSRQNSHWSKALGQVKSYHTDPQGWQHLREHSPEALDPREWTIYYLTLEQETAITALEGALIHLLQPLANDETFRDNGKLQPQEQ